MKRILLLLIILPALVPGWLGAESVTLSWDGYVTNAAGKAFTDAQRAAICTVISGKLKTEKSWTEMHVVPGGATAVTFDPKDFFSPGSVVQFKARAVLDGKWSGDSNIVEYTVPGVTGPTARTLVQGQALQGSPAQ